MGRVLRSTLPSSTAVLQPDIPEGVYSRLKHLQARQEHYYNRNSQPLPVFAPGATVYIGMRRGWMPATVTNKREEPRSHDVKTPSGDILRRNRHHVRQIHPRLHREEDVETLEQPVRPQGPPAQDTSSGEDNSPSVVTTTCSTRSGRSVKLPVRYRDFEMSQR